MLVCIIAVGYHFFLELVCIIAAGYHFFLELGVRPNDGLAKGEVSHLKDFL